MTARIAIATATMGLIAGSAQAQDCMALETQGEMTACAARALEALEADLSQAAASLQEGLSEPAATALRTAQTAWRDWRDAQCAFESAGLEGGSARPFIEALCRVELTEDQLTRLGAASNCAEGDIGCVGG